MTGGAPWLYRGALTVHTLGGTMKAVWLLLALLFTCLALGGFMSFTEDRDWIDLGMSVFLGVIAVSFWRRTTR